MSENEGWWSRNWTWFVPVGCLTIVFLFIAGIGMVIWLLFSSFRSNDVLQGALDAARADPRVVEALGEPIEMGWMFSGSIRYQNREGDADMTIPISGPHGSGSIRLEAVKQGADWTYHTLEVTIDSTSEIIDLIPGDICRLIQGKARRPGEVCAPGRVCRLTNVTGATGTAS